MDLSAARTAFFYGHDMTVHSRRWYNQKLTAFFDWCAVHSCDLHTKPLLSLEALDAHAVREYIAHLQTNPSTRYGRQITPQTVHGYVRAIKAFLRWAVEEDWVAEKVARRLPKIKLEQKVIQTFTARDLAALLDACADQEYPHYVVRDRAILSVLIDTGIRASELCGLTLDRVDFRPHEAVLRVYGKGKKEREVGLGRQARATLHRYVYQFRRAFDPLAGEQHVFLARGGRGLETEGLDRLIRRTAVRAGIGDAVRCSAHTFRHTFAVTYLEHGGEVYALSRLLGHTSVTVTEMYLRSYKAKTARAAGISVLDDLGR